MKSIPPTSQKPRRDSKNFLLVIIFNLQKSISLLTKICWRRKVLLVDANEQTPCTFHFLAKPKSVQRIFRTSFTEFTGSQGGNFLVKQITHCCQLIVTSHPNKMLDLVRNTQLPNSFPKLFLWSRIWAICKASRNTRHKELIGTASGKQSKWGVCLNNIIRRVSFAKGNSQNH